VTAVYDLSIALVAIVMLTVVWRYESNPFVSICLTALIYFIGFLAIVSKLG
jgi:hypothetical protein